MKWAKLEGNIVREIIPDAATVPSVAHWYGEQFAAECRKAPNEVEQRWVYDPKASTFAPPEPEPEPIPTPDITELTEAIRILTGGADDELS